MLRGAFLALTALLLMGVTTVNEAYLPDPAMEAKARHIMEELRCLVCQSQSIANSDADLAADLRKIVRERVAAGDTEEEVKAYMVARYGDWVLLKPPVKEDTILLWFGPLIIILLGGAVLFVTARRQSREAPLVDSEDDIL
jgi:cytochrome c-type biogenesis protein CcmH